MMIISPGMVHDSSSGSFYFIYLGCCIAGSPAFHRSLALRVLPFSPFFPLRFGSLHGIVHYLSGYQFLPAAWRLRAPSTHPREEGNPRPRACRLYLITAT